MAHPGNRKRPAGEVPRPFHRVFERGAGGQREIDPEDALVNLRVEGARQVASYGHGDQHEGQQQGQSPERMINGCVDGTAVESIQPGWLSGVPGRSAPGPPGDERGQQRQRGRPREHERCGDRESLVPKELPGDTRRQGHGQKHGDRGERGGGHGQRHFGRPSSRGRLDAWIGLPVPDDVFHRDDGVVHQHADTEGKSADRHDVQTDAHRVEHAKCGDYGDRHGERHGYGVPEAAKPGQQDDQREDTSTRQGGQRIAYRPADEVGLVEGGGKRYLRKLDIELLRQVVDGFAGVQQVRVGSLLYKNADCRRTIEKYGSPPGPFSHAHRRHVFNPDQRAVRSRCDDRLAHIVQRLESAVDSKRVPVVSTAKQPGVQIAVGCGQHVPHRVERNPVRGESGRINRNLYFGS